MVLLLGAGALQFPALGRMAMRGVDIVGFELAGTTAEAARQLAMLGPDGIAAVRQQLVLDYAYLVLYAIVLVKACGLLAVRASRRGRPSVAALAPRVARLAVAAAVCDAVENVLLFVVTAGHTEQPWPGFASTFATMKFGLLIVVAAFLLVGLLTTLVRPAPAPEDAPPTSTG